MFSEELSSAAHGYDVVFVARKKTAFVKSNDLITPIGTALRKSGVIK